MDSCGEPAPPGGAATVWNSPVSKSRVTCSSISVGEACCGNGCMNLTFEEPRALVASFDRCISRCASALGVTVECQGKGLFEQADDLRHEVVCTTGSHDEISTHLDGNDDLAAERMRSDQA